METIEPDVKVLIDNSQRLRDLTFDLPRNGIYPKPSSKGLEELNRDACLALAQLDLTIKQGITSGILQPTNLSKVVMTLLNEAGVLMSWLHDMSNRGEITKETWRRARRLHRALWASVGNPPHNEF